MPGGSAGATVTATVTPLSGTVPQLVTDTRAPRVVVGGTTVGDGPGVADEGWMHEVETEPLPPVGTEGGLRPTAVITRWWNGLKAEDAASAVAVAPRVVLPSGAEADGAGTHTESRKWAGGRRAAAEVCNDRNPASACSNWAPSADISVEA